MADLHDQLAELRDLLSANIAITTFLAVSIQYFIASDKTATFRSRFPAFVSHVYGWSTFLLVLCFIIVHVKAHRGHLHRPALYNSLLLAALLTSSLLIPGIILANTVVSAVSGILIGVATLGTMLILVIALIAFTFL